jgi:hypothetical protein
VSYVDIINILFIIILINLSHFVGANQSYIALTIHFIDENWKIVSLVGGCTHIGGRKTAADINANLLSMLGHVSIDLTSVSAVVTDTENTNQAFGRALQQQNNVSWVGCLAHLINLVTGLAFEHESVKQTMINARKLIGSFTGSTQNMEN